MTAKTRTRRASLAPTVTPVMTLADASKYWPTRDDMRVGIRAALAARGGSKMPIETRPVGTKDAVLAFLEELEEESPGAAMKTVEIAPTLKRSRSSVSSACKALADEGRAVRVGPGTYRIA